MHFAGFQILGMPTFREFCSPHHQGKEQSDIELFLWIIPFLYYYYYLLVEGKKRIVGRGGEGKMGEIGQSSITERMVFHIYVVVIISI